jgi:hypothetical protein
MSVDQSEKTLESAAWTGRGFNPKLGSLSLNNGQLRYVVADSVLFDAPVRALAITWPWYGFGCQFWAHTVERKYFVSLMPTNNTLATWWSGIQRGRRWKRAIEQALRS